MSTTNIPTMKKYNGPMKARVGVVDKSWLDRAAKAFGRWEYFATDPNNGRRVKRQGTFETATEDPEATGEGLKLIGVMRNRKRTDAEIRVLVERIKKGWKNTGQGFIFGSEGDMIDGQGRFLAMYRLTQDEENADKVFPVVVVENAGADDPEGEEDAFDFIDGGKARTQADALYRAGLETELHRPLATALRYVKLISEGRALNRGGRALTQHETRVMAEGDHSGVRDCVAYINDMEAPNPADEEGTPFSVKTKLPAGLAYWATLYYLAESVGYGAEQIDYFLIALALGGRDPETGDGMKASHPISRLSAKLADAKRMDAETRFRLIVAAFNAYIEDEELKSLKIPTKQGVPNPDSPSYPRLGGYDVGPETVTADTTSEEEEYEEEEAA